MKNTNDIPGIMSPIPFTGQMLDITLDELRNQTKVAWDKFMESGEQIDWRTYLRLNRALEQIEKAESEGV